MAPKGKLDRDRLLVRRPGFLRRTLEDYGQAAGWAEAGLDDQAVGVLRGAGEGRKIVCVSTEAGFAEALVSQAVSLAGRLGSEIVALSVEAGGREAGEHFMLRAEQSARRFADAARAAGVPFHHVVDAGKPGEVVERTCARLRRVEFVLALREHTERDRFSVSMPLFEVTG